MPRISGTFDVTLTPLDIEGPMMGRMRIDKQFHGPLAATSLGQMLSVSTPVKGSAAYVAIERVSGTLEGRTGSFVLHHTGVMTRGDGSLSLAVVPDSGTDALVGIAGTMNITVENKQHHYIFDCTVPAV
jgi:Protein of unknown function (DUF3224)